MKPHPQPVAADPTDSAGSPPNPSRPPFEAVARELSAPLLRFLGRYCGDGAVAEELRQEALIRMERGYPSFAGRSSVKTWAFSIASRVAADHYRRPERRMRIVELDPSEEPADPVPPVEERMAVDEMSACVRGVIESLPEAYRGALILHDLEGLTAEEVAATSDCSLATAKIRIHRARERLRKALRAQCSFSRSVDGVLQCERKC